MIKLNKQHIGDGIEIKKLNECIDKGLTCTIIKMYMITSINLEYLSSFDCLILSQFDRLSLHLFDEVSEMIESLENQDIKIYYSTINEFNNDYYTI